MIGPMCEHLYALNVFFLNFFNALLIAWLAYARHLYAFQFILFLFLKTFIGRLIGLCTALYALNLFYFYLIFNDRLAYVWAFICSRCIFYFYLIFWVYAWHFLYALNVFLFHIWCLLVGGRDNSMMNSVIFFNRKFKWEIIFLVKILTNFPSFGRKFTRIFDIEFFLLF